MMRARPGDAGFARRGTVLITAMWVVLVLAGLSLTMAAAMREQATAAANYCSQAQAHAVAEGAAQFVMAEIALAEGDASDVLDVSCEGRQVGDGYFWILRPTTDGDSVYSFGITDEASKVSVNAASSEMLLKLPNMTAEFADSIVDWRDTDSEVSPSGAEDEHYLLLSEPYYCKNDLFETVEELNLVNGATEDILYGEDRNRNGVLDTNEDSDRDGNRDGGLYEYVTAYSVEPNVSSTGEARINVNENSSQDLTDLLQEAVQGDRYYQVAERVRNTSSFTNIFDFASRVGLQNDEFEAIADRITTTSDEQLVGRININTAPRDVLLCLPGLDESDVDALISNRSEQTETGGIAWVSSVIDPEKAVEIGSYITNRSYRFSADIVAVSGDGRAFKRYKLVVDAVGGEPRVIYWKDMTYLGWPLDPEIITCLRNGESLLDAGLIPVQEVEE